MISIERVLRATITEKMVVPVEFSSTFKREDFIRRWNDMRNGLEKKLSARWRPMSYKVEHCDADFEVADDFNISWTLHGSVLNRRILCSDFLGVLNEHVSASPEGKLWAVEFVIEISGEEHLPEARGEFLLHQDRLYIPSDDKFDYSAFIASVSAAP
jgi:hypothetical protein